MSPEKTEKQKSRWSHVRSLFDAGKEILTRSTMLYLALPIIVAGGSLLAGLHICAQDSTPRGNRLVGQFSANTVTSERVPQPSPLPADSLMKLADKAAEEGNHPRASELYQVAIRAAEHDGEPGRALLARHLRSVELLKLGHARQALHIAESLRSVSCPGEALWRHAVVTSVRAAGSERDWTALLTHLYKLIANWRQYEDGESLAEWARQRTAIARVEILLSENEDESFPCGLGPLEFAETRLTGKKLTLEEIADAPRPDRKNSVTSYLTGDRLNLLAVGAPVHQVVGAVEDNLDYELHVRDGAERQIYARLENLPPETVVNLALGSVGLCVTTCKKGKAVVNMDPAAGNPDELYRRAVVDLHKFLIRYPDSPGAGQAYFALGCIHLLQGRERLALNQLRTVEQRYPDAPCAGRGLYVAGRILHSTGSLVRAEEKFLLAAVELEGEATAANARLWAARCQIRLGEYKKAGEVIEEALQAPLNPSERAKALYELALCLEKTDVERSRIEELLREVSLRHPDSRFADPAGYRLGRLALDAGDYRSAARRYEDYLAREMPGARKAEEACTELLQAYLKTGRTVRAASLGTVLRSAVDDQGKRCELLSLLLKAYRQAGLERVSLRALNQELGHGPFESEHVALLKEKVRLLIDLGHSDRAQDVLDQINGIEPDSVETGETRLLRARAFKAEEAYQKAIPLCRQVALESESEEVRARACELMGRCFESKKQFEWAARAYAGHCPVSPVEGDR